MGPEDMDRVEEEVFPEDVGQGEDVSEEGSVTFCHLNCGVTNFKKLHYFFSCAFVWCVYVKLLSIIPPRAPY